MLYKMIDELTTLGRGLSKEASYSLLDHLQYKYPDLFERILDVDDTELNHSEEDEGGSGNASSRSIISMGNTKSRNSSMHIEKSSKGLDAKQIISQILSYHVNKDPARQRYYTGRGIFKGMQDIDSLRKIYLPRRASVRRMEISPTLQSQASLTKQQAFKPRAQSKLHPRPQVEDADDPANQMEESFGHQSPADLPAMTTGRLNPLDGQPTNRTDRKTENPPNSESYKDTKRVQTEAAQFEDIVDSELNEQHDDLSAKLTGGRRLIKQFKTSKDF